MFTLNVTQVMSLLTKVVKFFDSPAGVLLVALVYFAALVVEQNYF